MKVLSSYRFKLAALVALCTLGLSCVISGLSVVTLRKTVTSVFGQKAQEILSQAVDALEGEELEEFLKNPGLLKLKNN